MASGSVLAGWRVLSLGALDQAGRRQRRGESDITIDNLGPCEFILKLGSVMGLVNFKGVKPMAALNNHKR